MKPLILNAKTHHHFVFAHVVFGNHITRVEYNVFEMDEELCQLFQPKVTRMVIGRMSSGNILYLHFPLTGVEFFIACEHM